MEQAFSAGSSRMARGHPSLFPAHPLRWIATRFSIYAMVGIGGMAITAGLAILPNSPILGLLEPPEQPAAQVPAATPSPPTRAKGQSIDVPSELNSRPDAGTIPIASTQERIRVFQANHPGGLDVDPNAKLALAPPVPTTQSVPEPVTFDHPTVVDTATLRSGGTTVALYGIEGEKGDMAERLQGFLAAHGDRVTCQPQERPDSGFVCLQPDGTDVAEVVLVNGAARAKPDAPSVYRDQEAAAQSARRGIWASLPAPKNLLRTPMTAQRTLKWLIPP